MRTLVRHRRRAALRRWRTARRISTPTLARFITYRQGRVIVPDFVPAAWAGEPTMNYAVVPYAPSDPWAAHPMFAGWGAR